MSCSCETLRSAIPLLRQRVLSVNVELSSRNRRLCIWLSSTDADRVVPVRDNWISILRHHAQIAWLQLEVHLLACSGVQTNPLETPQSEARDALDAREFEIQLHHLIASNISSVRHRHTGGNRLSSRNGLSGDTQIAVAEFRVAQPIAKRIQRFAREVPIRPVCHPVVFEVRQLVNALVERN